LNFTGGAYTGDIYTATAPATTAANALRYDTDYRITMAAAPVLIDA